MTKEIDKSRIYTAVNADEVPIGSMGIIADNIKHLDKLICGYYADEQTSLYRIIKINAEYAKNRFDVIKDNYSQTRGNLFYLISKPNDRNQKHDDVRNTCQEVGLTKKYLELLKNKIEKEKNLSLRLFKITAYTEDHHEHGDYQQFYIIGDSIDIACEKIKNYIGDRFIAITNVEIKGTENKPENCPGYGLILD